MPIASSTAALRAHVVAGSDEEFGERLAFTPKASDQYAGVIDDPDRPAFEIAFAQLKVEGEQIDLGGTGTKTWASELEVSPAVALVDRARDSRVLGLRQDDIVQALDRPGQPEFQIAAVKPWQRNRLLLRLTEVDT